MPRPFSFMTATEIVFGRGVSADIPARIAALGRRVLLVHGGSRARNDAFAASLEAAGCALARFAVPSEPDIAMIEAGIRTAREMSPEIVVAVGGGAVVDAGKAIAALIPASRPLLDHLEVVGKGLPLEHAPLPFVAIPTTAGTGAEVTRNAVIGVPGHRRKVSLRDARMLARLAVVDPALTDSCPRGVTLASGLDAITQVIEPFVSTRANPLTDALAIDAIPRGLAALRRLMEGEDRAARDEMAWVSLCGGLALANAGLGAVHGLAGPLGGLTGAAHGAICGALLPHVLIANRRAVADKAIAERLDRIGAWIGEAFGLASGTSLDAAARHLDRWSRDNGLPGLKLDAETRAEAAKAAAASSSMKANPTALSRDTLGRIMEAAA
jgi:alcohol dehydrogenase class IV